MYAAVSQPIEMPARRSSIQHAKVQSVIIPRSRYTLNQAKAWVNTNNFKLKKMDLTQNYYRFRQREPKPQSKYFTVELTNGIHLIMRQ
jgi:hypothetical protein